MDTSILQPWLEKKHGVDFLHEIEAYRGQSVGNLENLRAVKVAAVSRAIVNWVTASDLHPLAMSITEFGVWASSEHIPLYETAFGRRLGTSKDEAAHWHFFEDGELDQGVSLLFMAVCFGWGLLMACPETGRIGSIDHDGRLCISNASIEEMAALRTLCESR
jgi:hypothetical protein